jgi:hypothetical protein
VLALFVTRHVIEAILAGVDLATMLALEVMLAQLFIAKD